MCRACDCIVCEYTYFCKPLTCAVESMIGYDLIELKEYAGKGNHLFYNVVFLFQHFFTINCSFVLNLDLFYLLPTDFKMHIFL